MAAQIIAGRNREVGVTLSPAGGGTFEIYLDGELVYNRRDIPEGAFHDPTGDVKNGVSVAEAIRTKLLAALDAAGSQQAAPAH